MPIGTLLPITILEGSGKRRLIVLIGSTLPRQGRATILGTGQRMKVNRYVGNATAKIQMLGPNWLPIRFGGILDDRRIRLKGAAAAMAYALEEISLAGRECTFTYGPFVRRVVFKKVVLQPLQLSMIRYSVELEVIDDGQGFIKKIRDGIRAVPGMTALISLGGVALAAYDRFTIGVNTELDSATTSVQTVVSQAAVAQTHLDLVGEPGQLVNSPAAQRALTVLEDARVESYNALKSTRRISWTPNPGESAFDAVMGTGRNVHISLGAVMDMSQEVLRVRSSVSTLAGKREAGSAVYIVAQGETLRGISRKLYGVADRWYEIYDANGLCSPTLVGGEQLIVKDIPTPDVEVIRQ